MDEALYEQGCPLRWHRAQAGLAWSHYQLLVPLGTELHIILRTFTRFTLHDKQPPFVFLCGLRGLWSFRRFGSMSEKTWKLPVMLDV